MSRTPPHLAEPRLTTVTDGTFEGFVIAMARGFQETYHADQSALFRRVGPADRFFGATVDGRWVSTYGSLPRRIAVPGGALLPVAAVTAVTVQPPHRRRGLLSAMMQRGLDDFATRGEPLAALWASEAGIYGRFGFGPAASRLSLRGARSRMRFVGSAPTSGSVDEVTAEQYVEIASAIWPVVHAARPGALDRTEASWAIQVADPEWARGGATELRFVVHYAEDGTADGFATYRFKEEYDGDDPIGEVRIDEVHAASSSAYSAIWRYLLDIDLSTRFVARNVAVDEPLRHLLVDARALRTELTDNIYLRVIDVVEALRSRRYAAEIDLVIGIYDKQLPTNDGRYRVRASAWGAATVERTDDPADLSLGVLELGTVYLGGVSLAALASAGRVERYTDGALYKASEAFRWPVAPHCADHF